MSVRGFSQIFVISHDDTFERVTDHIVRVIKEADVSRVEFSEQGRSACSCRARSSPRWNRTRSSSAALSRNVATRLRRLRRLLEMVAAGRAQQLDGAGRPAFPRARCRRQNKTRRPADHPVPAALGEPRAGAGLGAEDALRGRPTFAVDGSQIPPQRTFSVPVAMVQIGWFENPHAAGVATRRTSRSRSCRPSR